MFIDQDSVIETDNTVIFKFAGEPLHYKYRPLNEVCAECIEWQSSYDDIVSCQVFQKKDAEERGFKKVVCPHQFVED